MNFSSPIFLFAFLPLVLAAYHLLRPMRAKNALLIAAGLIFYAFGDLRHLPLLLASCVLHYFSGVFLLTRKKGRKAVLAACITVDLAVLAAYKSFGTLPQPRTRHAQLPPAAAISHVFPAARLRAAHEILRCSRIP